MDRIVLVRGPDRDVLARLYLPLIQTESSLHEFFRELVISRREGQLGMEMLSETKVSLILTGNPSPPTRGGDGDCGGRSRAIIVFSWIVRFTEWGSMAPSSLRKPGFWLPPPSITAPISDADAGPEETLEVTVTIAGRRDPGKDSERRQGFYVVLEGGKNGEAFGGRLMSSPGVGVIERWYIRNAIVGMRWGRDGRGDMRCRVRMMAGDVTQWI
ncbi:hypothetical protein H4582DRAFT_2131222 [Lactarius indigo]|nr:hypothetical protein H4582DRAFT_2131222 [Lactarius indigo]